METFNKDENQNLENKGRPRKESYAVPSAILIGAIILSGALIYNNSKDPSDKIAKERAQEASLIEEAVLPKDGIVLPVSWGDLGAKLVDAGAIDGNNFRALYEEKGLFSDEFEKLLSENNEENLKITPKNSGYLLNLFWALGLANNNRILDSGEITDKAYGGAQNFASTAGWTMASGNPMSHYSGHKFFELTPEQQDMVDRVSRGIYRPCCNNPAHFPDCNHGMAMLGLLELMAYQGTNEEDMWKTALDVNSYWFPDTYLTLASFMKSQGVEWGDISPKTILGINYSSNSGYKQVLNQISNPSEKSNSGGCAV